MNPNEKRVLITGANSPLGLRLVEWAVSKKYNVIACARKESEELKALLSQGKNHRFFIFDLSRENEIVTTMGHIKGIYANIDLVINNACGWQEGGLSSTSLSQIREQIDSSITGNIILTKLAIPLLENSLNPYIINICSTVGSGYHFSTNTLYVVLKGALETFGRVLRNDLKDRNIKVTNIHLGKFEDGDEGGKQKIPLNDVVAGVEFAISTSTYTSVDSICLTPIHYEY